MYPGGKEICFITNEFGNPSSNNQFFVCYDYKNQQMKSGVGSISRFISLTFGENCKVFNLSYPRFLTENKNVSRLTVQDEWPDEIYVLYISFRCLDVKCCLHVKCCLYVNC